MSKIVYILDLINKLNPLFALLYNSMFAKWTVSESNPVQRKDPNGSAIAEIRTNKHTGKVKVRARPIANNRWHTFTVHFQTFSKYGIADIL
jgi:hypothetical protein